MVPEKKSNESKKDEVKKYYSKGKKSNTKTKDSKVDKKKKVIKKDTEKEIKSKVDAKIILPEKANEEPKMISVPQEKKEDNEIVYGLNRSAQKSYKTITKVVAILAMLGKIMTCIAIPFILVASILFTIIIEKIDYVDNRLYFDNQEVAIFENDEEGITLKIKDAFEDKDFIIRDNIILKQIQNLLESIPKKNVISVIIFATFFYEISLVIWIYIYRNLEALFNRLNEEETPFTEKNAQDIKNIGKLLIIGMIVFVLGNGIIDLIIHANITIQTGSINIIAILIIYTLYFIFKYGAKLQAKSNMRIANKK